MSISQVIRLLEHYKKLYGDLPCDMYMEDVDHVCTGIDEINCIEETYDKEHHVESICIMHKNLEEE